MAASVEATRYLASFPPDTTLAAQEKRKLQSQGHANTGLLKLAVIAAICHVALACATNVGAQISESTADSATVLIDAPAFAMNVDEEGMAEVQAKADEACALHGKKAVLASDAPLCVKAGGNRVVKRSAIERCEEFEFTFACVKAED